MNDSKNNECESFRLAFEKSKSGEGNICDPETEPLQSHAANCAACRQWSLQIDSLCDLSAALPQFDVPEALTQAILQSVETERRLPRLAQYPVMAPIAVALALALLTVLPFDSLEGIMSWGIGLSAMVLFKALLTGAEPGRQAV